MEKELKRVARLNLLAERKHRNLVNKRRNNHLKKDVELSVALSEAINERDFHHSMMHQAHNMAVSAMNNL